MTNRLFTILFTIGLTCCKSSSPDRLADIPHEAFWAGKDTVGHWFLADSINKTKGTVHFRIYNDKTGKLVADKNFELHCYLCDNKIKFDDLKNEIRYYDEIKYNSENYIILKTRDADNKNCYFQ